MPRPRGTPVHSLGPPMHSILVLASLVSTMALQQPAKSPAAWRLSSRPILSLGSRDAAGPELFGKVAGAVRLSSGVVVVVDAATLEVRFFSPTGKHLKTAGRRGAGPGEFRTVKSVRLCGSDSTFVYDPALMRISVFTPTGTYARGIDLRTLSVEGPPPYDFWCNRSGVLAFVHRSSEPPQRIGPRRPKVAITVASPTGAVVSLGSFPASERYFLGSEDIPRPLGKQTSVALGSTTAFVGTGDGFEVSSFALDGNRRGTVRDSHQPLAVTSVHVERFIARLTAGLRRGDPAATERLYRELEYPKEFPPYAALMTDGFEHLWIEAYPIPGRELREWSVYSTDGVAIASLRIPGSFEILGAGADYVLGVWRGDDDVEYVRVYSVIK